MLIDMEPCWKYITNTAKEQIYHVAEEVAEVVHALKFESHEKLILEVLDVIQSCLTLLAILGVEQCQLDYYTERMKRKNSTDGRDYYGKPPSCDNCGFTACLIGKKGKVCEDWKAKEANNE